MDLLERQLALDTKQSFIVQAPAGSGKTELLTQRFLALLAKVNSPEEILALTFTRKAAQEMRHRILMALQDARYKTPLKNIHQQQTRALAEAALSQNDALDWHILEHPHRLKITTFDAFCLEIYQSIPLEKQTIISKLSDFPDFLYRQAIQKWFNWCREQVALQAFLKRLLKSVSNRPETLFKNLKELLEKRDQWLTKIQVYKSKDSAFHQQLFKNLIQPFWDEWNNILPKSLQQELVDFLPKTWEFMSKEAHLELRNWHSFENINKPIIDELRKLLLTGQKEIRKSFDHNTYFKKENGRDAKLFTEIKKQSSELLGELAQYPKFVNLLINLSEFPDPLLIDLDWSLLEAYYQLLPLLVAHLHLEFEEQEQTDFIYVSQQAKLALEESDLAMYLENQLHHLLIDEFQDTSWSQLEFIHQLTQDFEQHPYKTIFLVGDPMQSIYRFRSADVGIFLQIQQQGLVHLKPKAIFLKQNFRSAPEIIHNLNQQFETIFPEIENISLGGVKFHHAHPALPQHSQAGIEALYFEDNLQQTQKIIEIIKQSQNQNITSIAILVRSRRQLQAILKALNNQKLAYQGVDLIPLSKLPIIRDIWNFAQVLLRPNQRIHELVILRSPFVGLSLHEIELLCVACPDKSLLSYLINEPNLNQFSKDSQQRLRMIAKHLQEAQQLHMLLPFNDVLQGLLNKLKLKNIITEDEQAYVFQFYNILDGFCEKMEWPDADAIEQYLEQIYISSNQKLNLQVMTIHKSKGLEFDWVIIPNMGDSPTANHLKALEWVNINSSETLFIPTQDNQANNELIKWFENQQMLHEIQRLCYVGLTRAKSKLFLLDDKQKPQKNSFRDLFPEAYFIPGQIELTVTPSNECDTASYIQRLTLAEVSTEEPNISSPYLSQGISFEDNYWHKQIGIITHQLLQWICEFHPKDFDDIPWQMAKNKLFHAQNPDALFMVIKALIEKFWYCPHGQWIMQARGFEKNEYALLVKDEHITRESIIDRTFIENDKLWIIDFKTAGEKTSHKEKYIQQLERYALQMSELFPKLNIHCGIYYLSNQHFHQWSYQQELQVT